MHKNYITFTWKINFYNVIIPILCTNLLLINIVLFLHLNAISSTKLFVLQSDMVCKLLQSATCCNNQLSGRDILFNMLKDSAEIKVALNKPCDKLYCSIYKIYRFV